MNRPSGEKLRLEGERCGPNDFNTRTDSSAADTRASFWTFSE